MWACHNALQQLNSCNSSKSKTEGQAGEGAGWGAVVSHSDSGCHMGADHFQRLIFVSFPNTPFNAKYHAIQHRLDHAIGAGFGYRIAPAGSDGSQTAQQSAISDRTFDHINQNQCRSTVGVGAADA